MIEGWGGNIREAWGGLKAQPIKDDIEGMIGGLDGGSAFIGSGSWCGDAGTLV